MVASFFPTMYTDETLYSVIGRYHLRSGNISLIATLEDLFNYATQVSIDLPSGVGNIVKALPMGSCIKEQELIFNHTSFLYYTCFLPANRADEIYQTMIKPKGQRIHYKAGIMGSTISLKRHLRYCPLCSSEDLSSSNGEMYWHRLHQIPGVEVCIRHNVWLMDSTETVAQTNKYEIRVASEKNCNLNKVSEVEDSQLLNRFHLFVSNVEKILTEKYPNKSVEWFHDIYKNKLIEQGYANIKGSIDQVKLKKAFLNYYGESLLEHLQSSVKDNNSWLTTIVRKPRKSYHPIRHLLLTDFLGLSLDDVFNHKTMFHPFGEAPWPCLNPACKNYRTDVISTMNEEMCDKTREPIGIFQCECGFKYSRRGYETSKEDRYKISRVKQFGHVWQDELDSLIKQDLSIREIGRRLNADGKTIIKYAEAGSDSNIPNRKEIITEDKLRLYRREWEDLQLIYPEKSKSELRKEASKIYSWLYHHDRDWLSLNSPLQKQSKVPRERVDWGARDNELLELVKDQVQKILSKEGRPERLSLTRIGTLIGKQAILEKKLEKLEKTKEYLDRVTETLDQFRNRKVEWAFQELERRGEEIRPWKVQRLVGVYTEIDLSKMKD